MNIAFNLLLSFWDYKTPSEKVASQSVLKSEYGCQFFLFTYRPTRPLNLQEMRNTKKDTGALRIVVSRITRIMYDITYNTQLILYCKHVYQYS